MVVLEAGLEDGLSSDAKRILASKSTHYVQRDEPELVIEAALELVNRVRRKNEA